MTSIPYPTMSKEGKTLCDVSWRKDTFLSDICEWHVYYMRVAWCGVRAFSFPCDRDSEGEDATTTIENNFISRHSSWESSLENHTPRSFGPDPCFAKTDWALLSDCRWEARSSAARACMRRLMGLGEGGSLAPTVYTPRPRPAYRYTHH